MESLPKETDARSVYSVLTETDAAGDVALGDPEADPGAANDQHARDVDLQQKVAGQTLQMKVNHQSRFLLWWVGKRSPSVRE